MTYAFHGLRLSSAIPLPEIRPGRGPADVSIQLGDVPDGSDHAWFHSWPLKLPSGRARKRPWLSFARRENGYLLRFHDLSDFEVSGDGRRITCRPTGGLSATTLRHLLLDQVMPLVLSQSGRLVLHASAVHVEDFGAIAFAGRAGSGKSTLAAALARRGCQVVTDDCLVITSDRGAPSVVPGYQGLRLWRDAARALGFAGSGPRNVAHYTAKQRVGDTTILFRARPTPLRAIVVLARRRSGGRPTSLTVLRSRDALMRLAPYAYVMDVADRGQLSAMFSQLAALVPRVLIGRLAVRDGRRQMLRSADEVLALAARIS